MGKITGLEDIHQVPPKVHQMYMAVIQMLEEGADALNIRVSTITERAGIGKGTAYEYFDSKDEIVACAIVYQIQCIFDWLGEELRKRESFREQLDFLLDAIDKKECYKHNFFRFVHIMTDNSEFNCMIRDRLSEEAFSPYLPKNVFGKILRQGVERGELREDLPIYYMVICVFSHLLSYMLTVTTEGCFHADHTAMRPLVYQGILNELERV